MKKIIPLLVTIVFAVLLSVSALAADYSAVLVDDANVLTSSEETELLRVLEKTSNLEAMNVAVVITDDKDGKSSMVYADDYYDMLFGINTDGILLLLDNEDEEDWISTSGIALDSYYTDYAVEKIFDDFYTPLHNGDFDGVIRSFANSCTSRKYLEGYTHDLKFYDEDGINFERVKLILVAVGIATAVVLIGAACVRKSYKGKNDVQTDCYNAKEQLYYRQKSDHFVREYTTSVSVSSSSGGGGGGHRSSHRSSRGGRHGGGGRHR